MDQQPSDRTPPQPQIRATPSEPRRAPPRCGLVLHHDHAHELMFVVRTIMELTRYCRAEATHKMWEAYHCGRATLLTTHRERAEFFAERFMERGLHVTVESIA